MPISVARSAVAAISAGTALLTGQTAVFSNSNGVSFGANGGTITASVAAAPTASVNFSAGTTSQSLASVVFSNSNNLSFGLNGSTVTASASFPAQTQFVLSNSNNVSFGTNGSTVTASASYSQSTAPGALAAGTQTATSGTVVFSDSNGISFGLSGSTRLTASYTVPSTAGLISAVNFSAGTTSGNLGSVVFSNSNGLTFGLNGSTVTGSHNGLTAGVQSISAGTTRATAGEVVFSNSNGVSFGLNGNTVTVTVQPGAAAGIAAIQGGTQTATSGTVVFSDSNGISFGLSGSTRMTASYTVPTVPAQLSVGVSTGGNTAGDTGVFTGRVVFAGGNNVTLSGSSNAGSVTYTISGPNTVAQTNQTVGLYALGNTTQNSSTTLDARTLSFNGLGGMTVGYSNGSIQMSAPSTAGLISAVNLSAGTTSNNLTAFVFSNSNNVSFGLNGSTVTATITVPAQTNQSVGFYAVGNTTQNSSTTLDARTISFNGLGAASVGYSNGSIQISVPAVVAQTNQTVGLYAVGNTTQNSSTTLDARTISYNGLGAATMGFSNGSVQVSVPVQTAQTQSNIQAVYDGANSISTGTIRFTNANGVSFSVNGQTVSASIASRRVSILPNIDNPWGQTNFTISNASFSLQPFVAKADLTATQANFLMALAGNTNSSGALTISMGIYTMAGSTLSLASSDSRQISWTSGSQTTTGTIYGGVSGTQYRTLALASWNLSGGQEYMLGVWYRTTNDGTWRVWGQQGPTIVNGLDSNETSHYMHGFSTSSYTTAMVASLNITGTNFVRTGGDALKQPSMLFMGTY